MVTPEARAPAPTALEVGDVVANRYRIDAVLGEGGMGIVYRAEHLHLRKPHALKVLLPEWVSVPEVVARFEREAVAAGNIDCPHVAAATDFGRLPSGAFFLVMDYVDGRTLRSVIASGPMDPLRAVHVLKGMAVALNAAHKLGIVHRDMKPENVMLIERNGDPDFVKVLDFGIAKVESPRSDSQKGPATALTQMGAVIGTPDYMSPEQALGQPIDARSDLYSVGVILFEMLTGAAPYAGGAVSLLQQHAVAPIPELPSNVAASAGSAVRSILERLMAKRPEDRFSSAADLILALDECAGAQAPRSPSLVQAAARTKPDGTTHRRIVIATVALVVAAATVVVLQANATTDASTKTSAPSAPEPAALADPENDPRAASSAETPPTPAASVDAGPRPRSSPGRSASPPGHSRRVGPGGIYIPPPKTWFK